MDRRARALLLGAVCALGADCARDQAWLAAETSWKRRDPDAFRAWRALDPSTMAGASAQRRLAQADVDYRRGIALLADGKPGAREVLLAASAEAPIDPALYLPLARACRARSLTARAAELYRKFLAAHAVGDDVGADSVAAARKVRLRFNQLGLRARKS